MLHSENGGSEPKDIQSDGALKRYLVYSHPAAFIGQWVVIDEVWCALRWTDVQHVKLAFDHLRVLVFCGAPAHLISIGGWVKIASRLRIFCTSSHV